MMGDKLMTVAELNAQASDAFNPARGGPDRRGDYHRHHLGMDRKSLR